MQKMHEFLTLEEVTTGDEAMSRRAHAEEAIRNLKSVELARNAFQTEEREEIGTGSDEMALSKLSAELAHFAFSAGVHAQLALGKEVEKLAVVGLAEAKVIEQRLAGAKAGARGNAETAKAARVHLMEAMYQQKEKGKNASEAAKYVHEKMGLGKSPEALRKMWINHRQEFLSNRK